MRIGLQIVRFDWPGSPGNIGPKLAEIGRTADAVGFTPGWVDTDGALQSFAQIYAAFPDLKVDFEELHVVGDCVFGRIRVEATHIGPLFGAPATGKKISFSGADFVRMENGKVVERWWIVNALVILQQLGLAPSA